MTPEVEQPYCQYYCLPSPEGQPHAIGSTSVMSATWLDSGAVLYPSRSLRAS